MPVLYTKSDDSYDGMDDNGASNNIFNELNKYGKNEMVNYSSVKSGNFNGVDVYANLYHANNMRRDRSELYSQDMLGGKLFTHTFRFGTYNPYGAVTSAKEFLFFTKPDLHIIRENDETGVLETNVINRGLNSEFWTDMVTHKSRIVSLLQAKYLNPKDPFNHLLQNTVVSNLDVPSLNAPSIETSTNTFGVSLSYRGSSEESDDGPEFSLEFKDDRYLNVYSFFRAYEDYETRKKHGLIAPQRRYLNNKIIHDQFSIYKIIVDEDMESILYWGKYYGVYPTSLPRDAFNSANFQDGLGFSINFKAAFYEDMRPEILYYFNELSKNFIYERASVSNPKFSNACKYRIDVHNDVFDRPDGRAARAAMVAMSTGDARARQNPNGYYYKLLWRGDDKI